MNGHSHGYALITILAFLLLASSVYLARRLPGTEEKLVQKLRRDERQTAQEALETAKARLIALALSNTGTPGAFPCPDYLNNGKDNSTCASYAIQPPGRNPYVKAPSSAQSQFNMTPPPMQTTRRRKQECLWYAISPSFGSWINNQNRTTTPPASKPGQGQLNPDNPGDLHYNDVPVVAVLIAPGDALGAQTRQASLSPSWCTRGEVADYLETLYRPASGQRNNADSKGLFTDSRSVTIQNKATGFCQSQTELNTALDEADGAECHNDVILPVTRDDLMRPLIKEILQRLVANEVRDSFNEILIPAALPGLMSQLAGKPSSSLDEIRQAEPGKGSDPNAFDAALFGKDNLQRLTGAMDCTRSIGIGRRYDSRPLWLCANGWYRFIDYDADKQTLSISLDKDKPTRFTCRVFLSDNRIHCQ